MRTVFSLPKKGIPDIIVLASQFNLITFPNIIYTDKHLKLYKLIRSLRDKKWSYRRISKYVNEEGVLTASNKKWGVSGNSVYSVLKRYQERKERIDLRNKRYKPVWSKMWIEYERSN